MLSIESDMFLNLSLREQDCLRLLCQGNDTSQVAVLLGISKSTLNKHLFSIRRKLSVRRTSQALLVFQHLLQCRKAQLVGNSNTSQLALDTRPTDALADELAPCHTFEESWEVLRRHLFNLGVKQVMFGLCAEPPGFFTNGSRILRMSLPADLANVYINTFIRKGDPVMAVLVRQTTGVCLDCTDLGRTLGEAAAIDLSQVAQASLDLNCRHMLCQPSRDPLTGAPHVMTFVFEKEAVGQDGTAHPELRAVLGGIQTVFWESVQENRLLRKFVNLSARQLEVLNLIARGFKTAESAEAIGVSRRMVDKALAGARHRLGAPNTAAAIYRSMVYRALA